MKKLVILLSAFLMVFVSCKKDEGTTPNTKSIYTGVFEGSYTFGNNDSTRAGKVVVLNNPLVDDELLMYAVLPFSHPDTAATGVFYAKTETVSIIVKVLENIGVTMSEDNVKDIYIAASFNENKLRLDIRYTATIMDARIEVRLIRFEGIKKSSKAV